MRVERPSSTEEAAAILREAASAGLAVRVRGQGTKDDWAVPPSRCDLVVETGNLSGVVEHAASDLVAVVRAGTRLADLQEALSVAGQQLALDETVPGASVGGTVAVNTSGPRRLSYGTVRDLLIGVTVVRPDGAVAHAGGKVVKNVAGYDLGKLFTGSYGTLGLITECVFRLHPLAPQQVFVPGARRELMPAAIEVNAPPGAPVETVTLLERRAWGGESIPRPSWWGRYPWTPGGVGLKLTAALSKVDLLLAAAPQHVTVRGSLGTGVLYAWLPAGVEPAAAARAVKALREAAHEAGGHAVVLTAPPEVRELVDVWGPVPALELMRRVKAQFDPDRRFAPGSFVGGL
jgi:glycolate dehydrogenase FAD-binding subunit